MEFFCDKCDYTTTYKHVLSRHLLIHDKEQKESKDLEFKCTYPGCTYSSSRKMNLDRHILNCKLKPIIINNITNIDNSETIDNSLDMSSDNSITIDNSNNSVNNTINNIQILLPWDNPLIGFALEQSLDKYLQEVNVHKVSAKDILDNVLRKIYFNPAHPENHSIKMDNQKKGIVTVYNGSSFEKKTIDDIRKKMTSIAIKFVEFNGSEQKFPDSLLNKMDSTTNYQINNVSSEFKDLVSVTQEFIKNQGPISDDQYNQTIDTLANNKAINDNMRKLALEEENRKKEHKEKMSFIKASAEVTRKNLRPDAAPRPDSYNSDSDGSFEGLDPDTFNEESRALKNSQKILT